MRGLSRIVQAAIRASDPQTLLLQNLSRHHYILTAGAQRYDLRHFRHIYVIGAGKASGAMAAALESILSDRITEGLVSVKYGYSVKVSRLKIVEAAHPVPDLKGMQAAERMVSLLQKAEETDLVIALISGGGSALMPLPVKGVSLAQKQQATHLLLRSGATIHEINAVRKHLSRVKGGWLVSHAAPARVLTLILSDVPGNPLDTIASGPTTPDASTYQDAIDILKRYHIWSRVPGPVRRHLVRGRQGLVPETPKSGDPIFRKVQNLVIGDNRLALKAAVKAAREAGFQTRVLTSYLKGEAREVARVFGAIAKELRSGQRQHRQKRCVLASGETTVTVRGNGRGGRCQEFALAAAMEITGLPGTMVAAFGTDGTDGPTEAAGAYADGDTLKKATRMGLTPVKALKENNAFPFFKALNQLIITGPTRTNVNDLYLLLTW